MVRWLHGYDSWVSCTEVEPACVYMRLTHVQSVLLLSLTLRSWGEGGS